VLHLHTRWGQTFAATDQELLPCSQPAIRLWRRLGRHAYEGLAFEPAERARLVAALGQHDGLVLENHGTLTVGRTVGEAFVLMHWLERAIQIQMTAMATGTLKSMSDDVAMRTQQQWLGDGTVPEGTDEWSALLRSLDQPVEPRVPPR
jgi:ribulose-5-phosphate 4-epimerase/fuculose-1-phosphate aldolase